ncbi:histidinol-phosphate transaminase [Rhodoferax sp.]|uniref:histidinol-phosphate transaminase n=1 Tax=Rhodoferax sp. TaxID=50421 RepID=UPI002ACD957F|nr:histidinol-phosphate transaminase [Rhodoferax sp.]MDZ7919035.1 histidinol-phosphate transaminase [Rhodoferax sp.]
MTSAVDTTLNALIARRIRQDVQGMHAYAVQESKGMTKLDAMENPFSLPPELQAALGQRLGALALNRYPDGRVNDLRKALAAYADMPAGCDIMLGNGSDELISLLAMACDVPPAPGQAKPVILAPVPGFVMYAMSAALQGLDFCGVPLTADFALDVPAMVEAIARTQPAIVYLAYPNNPTANLWDAADMRTVIAAAREAGSIVAVDEAYQPFSSRTWLDDMRAQPLDNAHVLLMRTLSKFGLAGVRLGYMMGPSALIAQIDKVRPPYNVSVLNYECALFALEHQDAFAAQAREICAQRAILLQALRKLPRVKAWDSDANMVLIRLAGEGDPAQKVFDGLKARGVLVKNVSKMHPLLAQCLRLTVGTADENTRLLKALQETL